MALYYPLLLVSFVLANLGCAARAAVREHTFHVGNTTVRRLCKNHLITAVNGQMPGPTIHAREGDTLIIHVVNGSPYDLTIHWHGIFQLLSAWADGPSYITQCPIFPGRSYTYRFNITGQEGTLWWHAHYSMLRATVYGAIIIKPKHGVKAYPFPKPDKEVPIVLGEWWNANVMDIEREAVLTGLPPNISDAFTINGRPGDLYRCSNEHTYTYKLKVVQGKTYLLRIINAALNTQLFFKVSGHTLQVIAADASYTTAYTTDVVVIAPGQTIDALMIADAPPGHYYMAAHAYYSLDIPTPFSNTTTTGIVEYESPVPPTGPPLMPILPAFDDRITATLFYTSLKALIHPGQITVPYRVDELMFVTIGANLAPCGTDQTDCKKFAVAASMNNISFAFPTKMSLLEAKFKGVEGVYSTDFPDRPPMVFNFTSPEISTNLALAVTSKSTKVKKIKYNATVEMILQNTALIGVESHPMHLHGFNFFVLAQGFGNYNPSTDWKTYNLVNPQVRNTIAVPSGGWAVIRFKANNPGVWFMHCHLDVHLSWGLAMAFEVENGPDPSSTLPPPPPDYPSCY